MIILTGRSLGERQKYLNKKVKNVDVNAFDQYKIKPATNDADNIFLVDLAAKHRNLDFIIQTLKSGDFVHITRVLNKCTWLSNDEFAHIINVDNLHKTIFPLMSIKMKKKLLCAISIDLKTESRSIPFYEYCMEECLFNIAIKFLLNTPEYYKNNVILQGKKGLEMVQCSDKALPGFIGNSFTLAHTLFDHSKCLKRNYVLYLLRYLYPISGEKYLDLLEKYYDSDNDYRTINHLRLGRRITKEILKKHKDRVRKNPCLYIYFLNKEIIAKKSTVSDAKFFVESRLPNKVTSFWDENFCEKYKFLIDIIPVNERFSFVKKIFTDKYFNEKFEKCVKFYSLAYYNIMMTKEEKEIWALYHIATKEEILGRGNDYKWYEFVSFDKAFEEIKKCVLITPNNDSRMKMISVLIDSAKTQKEIEVLLDYFYKRHVNEKSYVKTKFLDQLIDKHNVLQFDDKCWKALEKIFHSLDVYSTRPMDSHYRVIALIYYIINKKTVPDVLKELILYESIKVSEIQTRCRELKPEKEEMVFQYIQKFFMQTVESLDHDVKSRVRYISLYLDLLNCFSKTKGDIAGNMNKYIKVYRDQLSNHNFFNKSEDSFSKKDIKRLMKKDASLVIDEFPAIKRYIETKFGRTNWLLRKLKIYFEHDIAKKYLQLLNNSLSDDDVDYRMIQVAVYGIFMLADKSFKIEFMKKHAPTNTKIDHANISRKFLSIQRAICGYSCISRPHMPLTSMNQYLIGDYVQYCLSMFNNCLNLPLPVCIEFVETLIDKPISIQKHGLRIAFQCFSTEKLITLLNKVWKQTKNISIRKILYKLLFDKVLLKTGQTQLFQVLINLTLDLHEDDDDKLFDLLRDTEMICYGDNGQYLVTGWRTVNKLPESSINFERKTKIIEELEFFGYLIPDEELFAITNEHVFQMLDEKEILNSNNHSKNGLDKLITAKWQLTVRYLTNVDDEEKFKKRLEIVKDITNKCLEMRNEVCEGKFVVRQFYMEFVRNLDRTSHDWRNIESFANMKTMFDIILKYLTKVLPKHEILTLALEIYLSDIIRDVVPSVEKLFDKASINQIEVIKTTINKYAERFVGVIGDIVQSGKYFSILRVRIKTIVAVQLERIDSRLQSLFYTKKLSDKELNLDDLSVILCTSLLKFQITEIYLHIIEFLPLEYCGVFSSEYNTVLSTVKAFNNEEVQCNFFEKFVNSDFVCR